MWPTLFDSVPTYAVAYNVGLLVFVVGAVLHGRRLGVTKRDMMILSLCYVVGMIPGAKALYDIRHGGFTAKVFWSIDHYMAGGLWGGVLVFLVLAVAYACTRGPGRPRVLDVAARSLPLPMAVAKAGCLATGCCYGSACDLPWAIRIEPNRFLADPPAGPVHPTQVYDLLVLLGTAVALRALDREERRGSLLPWFLVLYGVGRAGTESFRGDGGAARGAPFHTVQVLCLVAAAGAIVVLLARRRGSPDA